MGMHVDGETDSWRINVVDHPERVDSAGFRATRRLLDKILTTLADPFYGPPPVQAHHGGSLWVYDGTAWHMYLAEAGIEWSAQFCADPARVDRLRQNAAALAGAFPLTVPEMARLGYGHAAELLSTPITDASGIAGWVDSIFNAAVPLPPPVHIGLPGGVHHRPKPVTDIQHVKRSDFVLWVDDVAVTPMAPHGSGDSRVMVQHSGPTSALQAGQVLGADHPLAQQAFAAQETD